jgi:hypothetical protein
VVLQSFVLLFYFGGGGGGGVVVLIGDFFACDVGGPTDVSAVGFCLMGNKKKKKKKKCREL